MSVNVLDGQLSRTWNYVKNGTMHVIVLYHDPLTGVRSSMLDHEEILGSLGNSSVFMEKAGHRILFSIKGTPGHIKIMRTGWFGFDYECIVGGEKQIEITQVVSQSQGQEQYDIKIAEHKSGSDGYSEDTITWYLIETSRLSDGYTNTVHRRFKDFANLHADIQQQFKGHHLLSSLPALPEKKSKLMVDHTDPSFLSARENRLQTYLNSLVRIPHVADLVSFKAFIGLMEKVRETSMLFNSPTIGVTLIPCDSPGTPAVVGFIQNTDACAHLLAGDIVSKINGAGTGSLTFNGIVRMLKHLPRPIVVHFVQALAFPAPAAAVSDAWKGDDIDADDEDTRHLPSFSADARDSAVFKEEAASGPMKSETPPRNGESEYVSFAARTTSP